MTSRIHLRGFASMALEEKRRISKMGGAAAHAGGKAHKWTKEEAAAAARKRHAQDLLLKHLSQREPH
jgi:hypothetical protein